MVWAFYSRPLLLICFFDLVGLTVWWKIWPWLVGKCAVIGLFMVGQLFYGKRMLLLNDNILPSTSMNFTIVHSLIETIV